MRVIFWNRKSIIEASFQPVPQSVSKREEDYPLMNIREAKLSLSLSLSFLTRCSIPNGDFKKAYI
jgi:hypothetical protein